jgi:membrane protein implicated in regulation of membrane protease activity
MAAFAGLQGISPWWWVALAILLAAAEMVTVTLVLIWASLAALTTAIALWMAPSLGGAIQVALFATLTIAFTFAGRALVARFGQPGEAAGKLNRRADQMIGREGVVIAFDAIEGKVSLDGVPWPARLEPDSVVPRAGDRVRVTSAEGIVVRVRPLADTDAGSAG